MFIGRTNVEAEAPILWPPDAKSWLISNDPDSGKDWGQEEKGTTEDEMVGWHCQLNGHGFGTTLAVGDEQGGLVCCVSWGHKSLDTTELMNWTELNLFIKASHLYWEKSNFFLLGSEKISREGIYLFQECLKRRCRQTITCSAGKTRAGERDWKLFHVEKDGRFGVWERVFQKGKVWKRILCGVN